MLLAKISYGSENANASIEQFIITLTLPINDQKMKLKTSVVNDIENIQNKCSYIDIAGQLIEK